MKLTFKQKASYGFGAVGKDMVYAFVSGFLMYYYNTVLGISATFIGVLFMAARVFDAFNDPFMGVVVEKTKSKWGKFRPWIFIGTLLNAIVLVALYTVPHIEGTALLVYVSVAYILWGMTYTIMDIPFWSMIPAVTDSGKDRENLSVTARTCSSVGYALPTALTLALAPVVGHGDERLGFSILGIIIAVFFLASEFITVKNVKETHVEKKESVTVKEMFKSLLQNDQALIIVVSIIVFNASLYLTQQLMVYFFKYDLGNAGLYGIFAILGGGAQMISMMLLPVIRKKFECKKILVLAISATVIGYAILFIECSIGVRSVILLSLPAIIIFMGFGLATVLTTIFLADTVDYGEYKNGNRNESIIFSLQTFVVKLASAFSVLIAGIGLDVIGLDQEAVTQSASTLVGLRFIMIIIPVIFLVLSLIFFQKKYTLDEKTMVHITEELKDKQNDSIQE